jgi:hypothetical protein
LTNNRLTYYNALDAYLKPLRGGIALTALTSHLYGGAYRSSEINLVYTPHFECKKSGLKIIPSIQVGVQHRYVNFSHLTYQQYEELVGTRRWTHPPISSDKINLDFSTGVLVNHKGFYAGGSIFHINQPDLGLIGPDNLLRRYVLHTSYNYEINKKTQLNFSALHWQQGKFGSTAFYANALVFRALLLGTGYRVNDAFLFNVGYQNKYLTASFGYELWYNRFFASNAGAAQLNLALSLNKREAKALPSAFERW